MNFVQGLYIDQGGRSPSLRVFVLWSWVRGALAPGGGGATVRGGGHLLGVGEWARGTAGASDWPTEVRVRRRAATIK